jgi:hypothetical protein
MTPSSYPSLGKVPYVERIEKSGFVDLEAFDCVNILPLLKEDFFQPLVLFPPFF